MQVQFFSKKNIPAMKNIPTVIGVFKDGRTTSAHADFLADHFDAKEGNTALVHTEKGRVILVGLGQNPARWENIGGAIYARLAQEKISQVFFAFDQTDLTHEAQAAAAAYLAAGVALRAWSISYKTKKKSTYHLTDFYIETKNEEKAGSLFQKLSAVNQGVFLSRQVISEPPNIVYPASMVEIAKKELEPLGVKVEALDEDQMKALGMNALLGVGQGSEKPSRLIVLQWLNGPKSEPPLAVVGKGVTFDTGGISLKPSKNMEDMKYDMGGSAVVLGLMKALAQRQAKANVVGVMGMAENMPSGSAQRPSDIVTSMSGQTIEVLNTDAEGRLVLADALWYTQERFRPKYMIDLATLTGAIVVALGEDYAGLFSNDDQLASYIEEAGEAVEERVWRFPMGACYDRDIDSDIADVKNIGSGRGAGSITAAQFLKRFVNDVPWAHLDIAGVTWRKKSQPLSAKGATGFGVRLLNEMIEREFEK